MVWFAFLYMQNLFIKKINWFRVVLITSFYCTESKNLLVIFAGLENLLFIFADFEQVKNSIRRNSLTYGMPCHAIGHFVFWYYECYEFERAFFTLKLFFTLHSFLLFSRLLWDQQFNLKASRASCWSLKHSPGPVICLNHNNPRKRYSGKFYLWFTAGWLCEESAPHRIWTLFMTSRKSRMAYLFGNRAIQSEIN